MNEEITSANASASYGEIEGIPAHKEKRKKKKYEKLPYFSHKIKNNGEYRDILERIDDFLIPQHIDLLQQLNRKRSNFLSEEEFIDWCNNQVNDINQINENQISWLNIKRELLK